MNAIGDTNIKATTDPSIDLAYIRFDAHSTLSTCSTVVLSSCSSEDEHDKKHSTPPLKLKRKKIINNNYHNALSERPSAGSNDASNNLHIDRNLAISAKENVAYSIDDELLSMPPRRLAPIPEDKLHRRNPHTVRQEIQMFETPISDTTLADVNLSEMPGLHNTEQWKRIAGRAVHASPPLSRQYYQTVVSAIELQDGQVPQPLGSYRRPGRSENEDDRPATSPSQWQAPRRRIFFGSSIAVVIVAIVVAVVLAITLIQKTGQPTTSYYSGSVYVNAKFDQLLSDPSSPLAKNYEKDLCTLIGTTLADSRTKYALFYSTCSVLGFRNGSIIADFVLGFIRHQNATRLNSFLNRSLVNKSLFGGTILLVALNITTLPQNNENNTTTENSTDYSYEDSNEYDNSAYDQDDQDNSLKSIMTEQNQTNDSTEAERTTTTIVTYSKLDTGLSITISETITITTNNSLDKSSINNKNYELILVPAIESTKTVVIPTGDRNEKFLLSPPVAAAAAATTTTTAVATPTTNALTKAPSQHNLLQPIKPNNDPNFAYIDESCDDQTFSSGDGTSTLEDLTTHDSTPSSSTISLNDETLLNSTSTLVNNFTQSKTEIPLRPSKPPNRPPPKGDIESGETRPSFPPRPVANAVKRQRRMIIPKNQRRLLQYELMPTGKVYYVDRPFYHEKKTTVKDDTDENASVILSTILSRSSSLDTLSDKHYRHRHHHHQQQQQQQNRRIYQDLTLLKKPEQKLSVGGRLASNNDLPASSPFKPININKKKRFSAFDPTPESLDRVFDVLIAADKRREEHEFWREKFDPRQTSTRIPIGTGRIHDTMNSNTIPYIRSKPTQATSNTTLNNPDNRSKSYTTKRNSFYESNHQQNDCLLEDCLRRRKLILQQQQQQQQAQRNYSPNIIYSTNYPKQQLPSTSKPPLPTPPTTSTTNQQPIRILPLSNGRIARAPQARQTSDELSSISDVWATRSSFEEESNLPKKPANHARFQSTVNRHRLNEQKPIPPKRATSVEQQKSNRIQNKNSGPTKNKFFDLFKFNR